LVSHGHDMGRVYVYAGNPTWLFMVIYGSNWHGTLRCEVTLDDGPPMVLGQFWLSGGRGPGPTPSTSRPGASARRGCSRPAARSWRPPTSPPTERLLLS
ncbi:MAG TPA: hypothetical protein VK425_09335, partial [Acidimicrobiales bacterium]|nr:hypothetical protein [Acidimicrobiales bacterium]